MFSKLIRSAAHLATTPIALTADVLTLGGILSDNPEDELEVEKALGRAMDAWED